MKDKTLIVSETFYSIQGEGQTAGTPAVFLRLAGCNLLCEGKGWRCDTIEVWQKGKSTKFEDVLNKEQLLALAHGANLVITGGEPLLYQEAIVEYLKWFTNKLGFRPICEIETNATVVPGEEIIKYITIWNVSPKLSNSGVEFKDRFNLVALRELRHIAGIRPVCWKFVVANERDVIEMIEEYGGNYVDLKKVWLMPAGASHDELAITRPLIADACKKFGFKYSERLHIVIWNQKTGV